MMFDVTSLTARAASAWWNYRMLPASAGSSDKQNWQDSGKAGDFITGNENIVISQSDPLNHPMESQALKRPPEQRFTLDGSVELERRLADLCATVRQEALRIVTSNRLEGLVLGGGYGRGQGGVLETEEGHTPYNDLEFYVFLGGNSVLNEVKYRSRFKELGDSLSPEAGLHVEFKID